MAKQRVMKEGDLECNCHGTINKDKDGFWLQPLYYCETCGRCYASPERQRQWNIDHPKKTKPKKK